jgi:hypothetical protein
MFANEPTESSRDKQFGYALQFTGKKRILITFADPGCIKPKSFMKGMKQIEEFIRDGARS